MIITTEKDFEAKVINGRENQATWLQRVLAEQPDFECGIPEWAQQGHKIS